LIFDFFFGHGEHGLDKPSSTGTRPLHHFAINFQDLNVATEETFIRASLQPSFLILVILHAVGRESFRRLSLMASVQHCLTMALDLCTINAVAVEIVEHQRSHLLAERERSIAGRELSAQ
jgi:hypothetical protein